MPSTREIKSKIKGVTSTQQITKAMHLVSVSKLQRAKAKLADTRPFFQETKRVISSIVQSSKGIKHPFLQEREVKNIVIILLTGDRGLCGGYNVNVCKAAAALMAEKSSADASLIVVGSKGRDYFLRRQKTVRNTFTGISEKPFYGDATDIGMIALDLFTSGQADEVYIAYTEFKSVISQIPRVQRLLPVDTDSLAPSHDSKEEDKGGHAIMTYEPDEETVLDYVIPKYVNTVIFGALVEASACEQGARMTSMDSATDNADEMIQKYTLQFNRARQGAITQEITEIVSGANALE